MTFEPNDYTILNRVTDRALAGVLATVIVLGGDPYRDWSSYLGRRLNVVQARYRMSKELEGRTPEQLAQVLREWTDENNQR